MTRDEYIILFEKHLAGKATPEEEAFLLSYRDEPELLDFANDESPVANQEQIRQRILDGIQERIQPPVKRLRPVFRWAVAASLALLAGFGMLWLNRSPQATETAKSAPAVPQQILPGDNKATLTLSDGSVVNLDAAADGVIGQVNNVAITKTKTGQLVYNTGSSPNTPVGISYNTVTTPRGGQYQVVLPDGTRVWLNAASSLKYPVQFTQATRHVELSGEAYFDIAHRKDQPFTVDAHKAAIKVLGTQFNVMAYEDEPVMKTTLLNGAVLLDNGRAQQKLQPGQQARITPGDTRINVTTVNTEDVVAWKNGYFSFRNDEFTAVMKKIARWYDVTIVYEGDMSQVALGGTLSRAKTLNELLHKIELTGSVKCKIEGRTVIVKKRNI